MTLDYNQLSGSQLKVLRVTILEAFGYDVAAIDLLMRTQPGLRPLAYYAAASHNADLQFGLAIDKMRRQYVLHHLVEAVRKSDFGANPALRHLDDRLSLAAPLPLEDRENSAAAFERAMSGFADAEVFLWSETLLERAAAMAQISYPIKDLVTNGTGIALTDGTVLTNEHVIGRLLSGHSKPETVSIAFNLALRSGEAMPVETMKLADEGWVGLHRPPSDADHTEDGLAADHDLDYAVLNLKETRAGAAISLDDVVAPPDAGKIVLILHHPAGQTLKLSLGVSMGKHGDNRLRYRARTVGGSSGGLVLDSKLRPVALHHAGDPIRVREATYNQGIPLMRIAEDIRDRTDAG